MAMDGSVFGTGLLLLRNAREQSGWQMDISHEEVLKLGLPMAKFLFR